MKPFNYDSYMKNNPLLKETDGYGNYKIPVLEDQDPYTYQSAEEFDLEPQDGPNDPLGPDEELMEDDDSSLFGPDMEKSRPGNLSDYYRNAEPTVKHVAKELDEILATLIQDKGRLEELTDLIVALADAYGEEQVDNYRSDMSTM